MISALKLLEGKKTVLGVVMILLAGGIEAFFRGSGWESPDWINGVSAVLEYFGYPMAGIGAADKYRRGEITITKGVATE